MSASSDDQPTDRVGRARRSVDRAAIIGPLVVLGLFIGLWYLLAYNLDNNFTPSGKPVIIPPPHRLFDDVQVRGCPGGLRYITGGELPEGATPVPGCVNAQKIWEGAVISLQTAFTGLAIAIVLGVALAVLMSTANWLERSIWPYLIALQAVPIIAITPLIIRTVGANFKSRVLTTVIIAIFPIVKNTLFGLLSAEQSHHDLFTLGGAGWWTRLRKLELPGALPAMFAGFQISAGLAVIGAVVGDFFFSRGRTGIGRLIVDFFTNNAGGLMVICAGLTALMGIAFFVGFGLLSKLAIGRWHTTVRGATV